MCEYCDHGTNEEAKRFPLFNENAKREEAFIDEDKSGKIQFLVQPETPVHQGQLSK